MKLNSRRLLKKYPWLVLPVFALILLGQWKQPVQSSHASADFQNCQVNSVYDGDTMRVTCDTEKHKVRLYCIDTPEMQQKPWGLESRDALRAITPKRVNLLKHDIDRYGRIVAEVFAGDMNLNLQMVKQGQAAVYARYCKDDVYFEAEKLARQQALGIWSREGLQQTPWQWRKQKKQ